MTELQDLPLRDLLTLAALRNRAGQDQLFDRHVHPGKPVADDGALVAKIKEGMNRALPLQGDEIREAVELVKTGKLTDELKSTLEETLTTVAGVPADIVSNPSALLFSPLNTIAMPVKAAGNTAKAFLAPDKRALRLAILAYARLHGINITENNITDVYHLLDRADAESLEDLARGGLETVKAEYGLNDLAEALQQYKLITGRNSS